MSADDPASQSGLALATILHISDLNCHKLSELVINVGKPAKLLFDVLFASYVYVI